MRRKDREVTAIEEIIKIIEDCKTCHLAMVDDGMPYVIPLSFGYEITDEALTLYFHSAKEGRKLDILHKNNKVCFEMCIEGEPILAGKSPCNSGYYYASVHGFGHVEFVTDITEKCKALSLLMKHQAGISMTYQEEQSRTVCIFKVISKDYSGKRKPRPES